jgi:Fe-S cluster assembly protein SufD
MTGSTTNSEILKYSYQLNKRAGEVQAFELLRSFGQKYLETHSWPSKKDENWRYTSTQFFSSQEFLPTVGEKPSFDENTRNMILKETEIQDFSETVNIVFINGIYQTDQLPRQAPGEAQAQIQVSPLGTQIRVLNLKNAIERGLYPIFDLSKPENSFEALNLSFLEEGVFIDIPENLDFKPIINLVFVSLATEKPNVNLPRVVIKVGAGATATVFENYTSTGATTLANWTNSQVEIHLQTKAKLAWARLQNEAAKQLHTCRSKIYLNAGTELHSLLLSQGANLHRHDLIIEVKGEHASANVHGISLGTDKEHRDHNTLINFSNGHAKAEQIFKSILHGESKSVFKGKIVIKQDSQKVDSSQLNQSLILSEKAEAISQPQLEIYADDVKATHGATIGQLSDEELFYFKSRGISEAKAKLMMTEGFAIDLVERFPNEQIKNLLRKKIKIKLQGFW